MPATISSLILSDRQRDALEFLNEFWLIHGYPPCLVDVSERLRVRSPNAAATHLDALVRKGFLVVRRITRNGRTRAVYAPTTPYIRVLECGQGVVLVGMAGGPVTFTVPAWREWLLARLEELPATDGRPALKIV